MSCALYLGSWQGCLLPLGSNRLRSKERKRLLRENWWPQKHAHCMYSKSGRR